MQFQMKVKLERYKKEEEAFVKEHPPSEDQEKIKTRKRKAPNSIKKKREHSTAAKSGIDDGDRDRIAKIIHEPSKDSLYF